MYPVYALYHYFPEAFWFRVSLTFVLLCAGIVLILVLYKKEKLTRHNRSICILLWIYMLCLLYITVIGRYTVDDFRARLIPFESYRQFLTTGDRFEIRGIVLNILIFIPYGVLTAELFSKKKPVVLAIASGLLFVLLIETLQFLTRTGTFETDDVIHNTLGTILGVFVWLVYKCCKKRTGGRHEHSKMER